VINKSLTSGTSARTTVSSVPSSDVLRAKKDATTGTTEVVAAVAGKRILVLSAHVMSDTAAGINFTSGASTAISAISYVASNGGFVLPTNPDGWFITVAGEALKVTQDTGANVSVNVTYRLM
jgi:hypothetical protein